MSWTSSICCSIYCTRCTPDDKTFNCIQLPPLSLQQIAQMCHSEHYISIKVVVIWQTSPPIPQVWPAVSTSGSFFCTIYSYFPDGCAAQVGTVRGLEAAASLEGYFIRAQRQVWKGRRKREAPFTTWMGEERGFQPSSCWNSRLALFFIIKRNGRRGGKKNPSYCMYCRSKINF